MTIEIHQTRPLKGPNWCFFCCQNFQSQCLQQMSRLMGKPTICITKTKTQISFAVTAKLISAFVFATQIVQFLFYLNPKFQAYSSFLCLYRPVCVGPVRKPHCWFSHEAAQISLLSQWSSDHLGSVVQN